ncbi:hypothetical protein H2199_009299 [Coniosporium tulheliwenetii]|uniref:Uncharacterized protein n=1 Tax=Coniosporium tulheliwenetii TaxID=3383036 RepID=A0ACC2YE92_9PEZI|nr:hypothetical protein H2199_009299 [Cladosporium sp. JES 115]
MTAICGLPAGWQQLNDPEGRPYYVNTETHESSRQRPGGLPEGWREAKDPDGKLFYVHDALQLASWYRPGEQPPVGRPTTITSQAVVPTTALGSSSVVMQPSKPNTEVTKRAATTTKPTTAVPKSTASVEITLGSAAEATVNLFDPTEGGIVRNTKIAAHMTAQGIDATVKKVVNNRRLKNFAKGTGLTAANRKVKKAWRNAERAVDSRDKSVVGAHDAGVSNEGIVIEEYEEGSDGEECPFETVQGYDVREQSEIDGSEAEFMYSWLGESGYQHLQQPAVQHEPHIEGKVVEEHSTYLVQSTVAEYGVYGKGNISVIEDEIGTQDEAGAEGEFADELEVDVQQDLEYAEGEGFE